LLNPVSGVSRFSSRRRPGSPVRAPFLCLLVSRRASSAASACGRCQRRGPAPWRRVRCRCRRLGGSWPARCPEAQPPGRARLHRTMPALLVNFSPRAIFALMGARPAFTRCRIMLRSNSANAPVVRNKSLPVGVVVSRCSARTASAPTTRRSPGAESRARPSASRTTSAATCGLRRPHPTASVSTRQCQIGAARASSTVAKAFICRFLGIHV